MIKTIYNVLLCFIANINSDQLKDGAEFEVIGDPEELKKEQEEQARIKDQNMSAEQGTSDAAKAKATLNQPATCKFSCIGSRQLTTTCILPHTAGSKEQCKKVL